MSEPKRLGAYKMIEIGGNVLLTVYAPRDGYNRSGGGSDLSILFNPTEFAEFTANCAFLNAGLKR